jgi:hypothetical protein
MKNDIQVHQSTLFMRAYKRPHPNEKADVDDAIAEIIKDPTVGEPKKGDLAAVFVYKFSPDRLQCFVQPFFHTGTLERDRHRFPT